MTKEELYTKRITACDKADGIFNEAFNEAQKIRDEAWAVADNEYRVGLAKLAWQERRINT